MMGMALGFGQVMATQLQDQLGGLRYIPPVTVKRLNEDLKKGKLPSQFPELKAVVDSSQPTGPNFKTNSFFSGIYDGYELNSPVFNRGNYKRGGGALRRTIFLGGFFIGIVIGRFHIQVRRKWTHELAEVMLKTRINPLTSRVMREQNLASLFLAGGIVGDT